jgi:hypothetical protein
MNPLFTLLMFALLLQTAVCTAQATSMSRDTTSNTPVRRNQPSPGKPLSDTCFSTYASGSGPTYFKWCVTENGNVVSIESPKGIEHIRGANIQEGYSICDFTPITPLYYWDFADAGDSGNWNAPVIVQPNGPNTFPLTIQRRTADGMFELDQKFSQNTAERIITIKMTVYETGCIGTCGAGLYVFRYANIDANNTNMNWFDQGADSAWGYNSGSPGVILYATPPPTSYFSKRAYSDGAGAFPLSDGPPSACNGDGTTGPFLGDGAVEVYQFFKENIGSPGTVGFEYKRF